MHSGEEQIGLWLPRLAWAAMANNIGIMRDAQGEPFVQRRDVALPLRKTLEALREVVSRRSTCGEAIFESSPLSVLHIVEIFNSQGKRLTTKVSQLR